MNTTTNNAAATLSAYDLINLVLCRGAVVVYRERFEGGHVVDYRITLGTSLEDQRSVNPTLCIDAGDEHFRYTDHLQFSALCAQFHADVAGLELFAA